MMMEQALSLQIPIPPKKVSFKPFNIALSDRSRRQKISNDKV
jgi:hypothetical protein